MEMEIEKMENVYKQTVMLLIDTPPRLPPSKREIYARAQINYHYFKVVLVLRAFSATIVNIIFC